MSRLLARLHGGEQRPMVREEHGHEPGSALAKASALLGLITSGMVIGHLVTLGSGGVLLFLRYGTGYTPGETTVLAGMAIISVLSFGYAARRTHRQRAGSASQQKGGSA